MSTIRDEDYSFYFCAISVDEPFSLARQSLHQKPSSSSFPHFLGLSFFFTRRSQCARIDRSFARITGGAFAVITRIAKRLGYSLGRNNRARCSRWKMRSRREDIQFYSCVALRRRSLGYLLSPISRHFPCFINLSVQLLLSFMYCARVQGCIPTWMVVTRREVVPVVSGGLWYDFMPD